MNVVARVRAAEDLAALECHDASVEEKFCLGAAHSKYNSIHTIRLITGSANVNERVLDKSAAKKTVGARNAPTGNVSWHVRNPPVYERKLRASVPAPFPLHRPPSGYFHDASAGRCTEAHRPPRLTRRRDPLLQTRQLERRARSMQTSPNGTPPPGR